MMNAFESTEPLAQRLNSFDRNFEAANQRRLSPGRPTTAFLHGPRGGVGRGGGAAFVFAVFIGGVNA